MPSAAAVFLDTMIYLHYRAVEEIRWTDVVNADEVIIVVPRVTIGELDKHKDQHPSSTIRNRARKRLQKIEEWAESGPAPLREHVTVQVDSRAPQCDYGALNLDRSRADDVLIASMIQYREENPGADLLLITQDTTPRLTARSHGIRAMALPDEFVLGQELDPLEKENRELKRQLDRYQSAAPKLAFGFVSEGEPASHLRVKLIAPPENQEEWITERVQRIREKYPKRQPTQERSSGLAALSAFSHLIPSEEYKRYNQELERFYTKYEEYLRRAWGGMLMQRLSVELRFELWNNGSAPAENIDFHLHFPDGFVLDRYREGMFDYHDAPKPPRVPRTQMQMLADSAAMMRTPYQPPVIPDFSSALRQGPPNLSAPDIEHGDSYNVQWEMRLLKHKQTVELHPLVVTFHTYEEAASFGVEYRVHAANVLDPLEGTLHVVVEKE
jgi:hypothetical protein